MWTIRYRCGTRVLQAVQLTHRSNRGLNGLSEQLRPTQLISRFIAYIDEVTGANEIREAHRIVMQNEKRLEDAQIMRRKKREDLDNLHTKMKQIHSELDKFSRGDDKYLRLLTEEHAIIKTEQALVTEALRADEAEKAAFEDLSKTLRASYAKEQEQAGRVKTWTLMASTLGALFGIIGTWIANEIRMRRIKELIPSTNLLQPLVKEITDLLDRQQKDVAAFIKEVREIMHLKAAGNLSDVTAIKQDIDGALTNKLVTLLQEQNLVIAKELNEVKRLIAVELNLKSDNTSNVVYVGSEMEQLLSESEKKIVSKMKLQTLVEVVFVYALICVSIPLVFAFFRGN